MKSGLKRNIVECVTCITITVKLVVYIKISKNNKEKIFMNNINSFKTISINKTVLFLQTKQN